MCNAIVGNFSYVKRPTAGAGTDATISVRAAASASASAASRRVASFRTPRVLSSTHLRCAAAKRVARAANANPISENNFSRGRILARLFKTFGPYWFVLCGTPLSPVLSSFAGLYFLSSSPPASPRSLVLRLSCRPIFSVPPLNRARFSQ